MDWVRAFALGEDVRSPEQILNTTAQFTFWSAACLLGLQVLLLASMALQGHVATAHAVIAVIGVPAAGYLTWHAWRAPGLLTSGLVLAWSLAQTAAAFAPGTAIQLEAGLLSRLVNWAELSQALLVIGSGVGLYASWRIWDRRRKAQARRLAI